MAAALTYIESTCFSAPPGSSTQPDDADFHNFIAFSPSFAHFFVRFYKYCTFKQSFCFERSSLLGFLADIISLFCSLLSNLLSCLCVVFHFFRLLLRILSLQSSSLFSFTFCAFFRSLVEFLLLYFLLHCPWRCEISSFLFQFHNMFQCQRCYKCGYEFLQQLLAGLRDSDVCSDCVDVASCLLRKIEYIVGKGLVRDGLLHMFNRRQNCVQCALFHKFP